LIKYWPKSKSYIPNTFDLLRLCSDGQLPCPTSSDAATLKQTTYVSSSSV